MGFELYPQGNRREARLPQERPQFSLWEGSAELVAIFLLQDFPV